MKNLRRMLACGLLLSQLFCGQAWAAEVHTPCYRNSVDTENSDFDKGEWKYRFTADSGQETVLTDGEKHIDQLIAASGIPAARITAALTLLQIKGYVRQETGKRFTLNIKMK